MVKSVKELDVDQRAYQSALEIHRLSKSFPKDEQFALTSQVRRCSKGICANLAESFPKDEQFALTSQVRRCSKGICANLAEGFAKSNKSSNEFRRFASMAVGSSEETKVWLDFSLDLGYPSQQQHSQLTDNYDIISKQIYTMIERWK